MMRYLSMYEITFKREDTLNSFGKKKTKRHKSYDLEFETTSGNLSINTSKVSIMRENKL